MTDYDKRAGEPLNAEQWAQRQTWEYRAIVATQGPRTQLGAVLLAVLGKQRLTRPQFGASAIILEDGAVVSDFTDRAGRNLGARRVYSVQELTDNFSRLADRLLLSDEDRIAMFAKVRSWIFKDYRTGDKNLHFTVQQRLGRE